MESKSQLTRSSARGVQLKPERKKIERSPEKASLANKRKDAPTRKTVKRLKTQRSASIQEEIVNDENEPPTGTQKVPITLSRVHMKEPDDAALDHALKDLIRDFKSESPQDEMEMLPKISFSEDIQSTSSAPPGSNEQRFMGAEDQNISLSIEGLVAVPVESTKCIYCEAVFKNSSELSEHLRIVHVKGSRKRVSTAPEVIRMEEDPEIGPTPVPRNGAVSKARRRKPRSSGDLGLHECRICQKRFQQMGHLRNHMRLHTGEKPFVCEMCGKAFSQSGHLVSHINSHTNTRPYECSYCKKRFTQSGHLRNHERLHLGVRPYQCAYCTKSFTQSGHLVNHLRLHDGEKPYGCPFCAKKFTQSGHLSNHLKTHNEGRGHQCLICSKQFAQADYLKGHMKMHSDERPFACGLCPAKFSTAEYLNFHAKLHVPKVSSQRRGKRNLCDRNSDSEDERITLAGNPIIVRVTRMDNEDKYDEKADEEQMHEYNSDPSPETESNSSYVQGVLVADDVLAHVIDFNDVEVQVEQIMN